MDPTIPSSPTRRPLAALLLLTLALLGGCKGEPSAEQVAAAAAAATAAAAPATDVLARVRAAGVIRFGADMNSPPMMIRKATGGLDGFEYRVQQAIGEAMGVKAEVVGVTWTDQPEAARTGHVDAVVAGWVPTPAVDAFFSEPYLESSFCLVVKKGSPVRSTADLAKRRVAIYNDPVAEAWATKNLPSSELVKLNDGFFDLLAGEEVDAVVYDYPFAVGKLTAFADRLRIVQLGLHPLEYAVLLPKGNDDLLDATNKAVDSIRRSAPYREWLDTFFTLRGPMTDVLDLGYAGPGPGAKVHVVTDGQTLRDVAQAAYGDGDRWRSLWAANKDHVAMPELLPAGTRIVIP